MTILPLIQVQRLGPNPDICRVGSTACEDKSVLTLVHPDGREVQVNVVNAERTAEKVRELVGSWAQPGAVPFRKTETLVVNPEIALIAGNEKQMVALTHPDGTICYISVSGDARAVCVILSRWLGDHALAWGNHLAVDSALRAAVEKQISLLTNPSVNSTGEGVAKALQAALDAEPAAAEPVAKPAVAGLREAVQLEIKRIGPSIYLRDIKSRLQAALDAEPERCPEAERLAEAIEGLGPMPNVAGIPDLNPLWEALEAWRAKYH